MTTLRAPKATRRLLRWTFRRGNRLLSCQIHRHDGFFTVATVPHWNADDTQIETFDRGIDAFRQHADIAAGLRQSGWDVVSYTGERPRPRPAAEMLPVAA
jgi:hypothetical protein